MTETYDLAIVGAGLSTLSFLRAGGARGRTVVVDYAERPGGWLQYAGTPAYISGAQAPGAASAAGEGDDVEMRLGSMAVGLLPGLGRDATHTLLVRSAAGTENIRARQVLIASGGLEVTREHDQIPGSRPVGVVTPIFVHQMLSQGYIPGTHAIVAGSSAYAAATAARLAGAGVEVVLVPPVGTETPAVDSRVRVEEPATIAEVVGFPRLAGVRLERDGRYCELPADMLVYARGMMANTLWLKGSGMELQADGAIRVTARYETNLPGVFAMGTVVTPDLDHQVSLGMGRAAARALEESDP